MPPANRTGAVRYVGLSHWIPSDRVYDYFLASDLAVFPGTHSVLWEQACACGLPGIYKSWEGMKHVDMNGSALFLMNDSVEEIKEKILNIIENKENFQKMRSAAYQGKSFFSYWEISKRAIGGDQ